MDAGGIACIGKSDGADLAEGKPAQPVPSVAADLIEEREDLAAARVTRTHRPGRSLSHNSACRLSGGHVAAAIRCVVSLIRRPTKPHSTFAR